MEGVGVHVLGQGNAVQDRGGCTYHGVEKSCAELVTGVCAFSVPVNS